MGLRYSKTVRPLVKVLVGVACIAVVLFSFVGTVAAKGPASAFITGPGIDQPIELINAANRDLVARLMEQTGIWYATGDLPQPIEKPAGELGPSYTLTWINSGPPEANIDERTIRQEIYLDAEYGPVIYTPIQESLKNWGPGMNGWFAAPSGLRDTLVKLGVPISPARSFGEIIPSKLAIDTALSDRDFPNTILLITVGGLVLLAGLVGALGVRRMSR
jgi:hypothetical protein